MKAIRKIKYLIFLILPIIFINCASFYKVFKQKSRYYSAKEESILVKTTKSINYDYGYDPDMDLDYVFSFSHSDLNKIKNERDFIAEVKKIDKNELVQYYEKIFILRVMTEFKMDLFKDKEKWNNYTFVKKYYLPPLEVYLGMLEDQVKLADREYAKTINERKNVIKEEVEDDLISKDIEEFYQERFYYLDY